MSATTKGPRKLHPWEELTVTGDHDPEAAGSDEPTLAPELTLHEAAMSSPPQAEASPAAVGEDLGQILRRTTRLTPDGVSEMLAHASAALEQARGAGLVHRDIKPSNLFLCRQPRIWKLFDFGVSKLEGQDATITRGHIMGTPAHMAPEQVRGESADHRSDVFSLATVAYRALTGRRPFSGPNTHAIMYAVADHQPPRPGAWVKVDPDVDLVLAIGLAKLPDERFQRAPVFAESFGLALEGKLPAELRTRARESLRDAPWGDTEKTDLVTLPRKRSSGILAD